MKVLYLVTGIRPPAASGSEFIKELIFETTKKSVEATIISPIYIHTQGEMGKWVLEHEKLYRVRFVLIDVPEFIKRNFLLHILLTPLFTTIEVIKVLSKEKFDLVHEFTSTPIILFRGLIYKLFRLNSVFTLSVLNKTVLGRLFWFKYFNFGTTYIIPSKDLLDKIANLGISKSKLFYLPPGIKISDFNLKISQESAREKLHLPKNTKIYTYFGPLTTEKGVSDLIEASRLLPPKIQQSSHIAIFSYYLKDYKNHKLMSKKLMQNSAQNVKLYEKYVDIPLLLRASDCIIYTQQTGHGTTIPPITVIETLVSQTPIIATSIIGVKELVTKDDGILVPPANPSKLAQAIERFHNNPIKKNSHKSHMAFDLPHTAAELAAIYNKLYEKQL